ncbi:MAG: hypothetical protein EON88_33690, partial [Brevundimonas sp.]
MPLIQALFALAMTAAPAAGAEDTAGETAPICANATGTDDQGFYTFWHDTGSGCMTLGTGDQISLRAQIPHHRIGAAGPQSHAARARV